MRKYFGLSLYVAGGLLLSFSGGRYLTGAVAGQRAREAWNTSAAKASVALARHKHAAGGTVADGTPVARLLIPSIDLDEIVLEGSDQLNSGPGHVASSALPGESGNSVIYAESDRHFSHLDALSPGDTIVTESGSVRDTWVVMAKRIVDKNDSVVGRTSDTRLTLSTSWPIRFVGPAPERLIVTAARVTRPFARVASAN